MPSVGNALSNQRLSGGMVDATVIFAEMDASTACEFILYYDARSNFMVTAGIGGSGWAYSIRYFDGQQWVNQMLKGDRANLSPNRPYRLTVHRMSSDITLSVDDVIVGRTTLPWNVPPSQVGLWCLSAGNIRITKFTVQEETPKAFIIMQFSPPYDDLYNNVIKPVCAEFDVEAYRADDTVGPGLILQDVIRQILEARFIIAEITPPNPNVFYEVGYAHAISKPTILIAEKPSELPFDVSGFRTLFYENSISGKTKIEDGLRKYIDSIMRPQLPV